MRAARFPRHPAQPNPDAMRHLSPLLLVILVPHITHAQSAPSDLVGYISLVHTPIGLLAPIAPRSQLLGRQRDVSFALRYGSIADGRRNNKTQAYAASVYLPAGQEGSFSLSAGAYKASCPDPECKTTLFLGAGGQTQVMRSSPLSIDVSGDFGWSAREFGVTYLTGHVGLPLTLTMANTQPGIRLGAWLTPGFGFGRASSNDNRFADNSSTGSRPTLGGGIALYNPVS